MFSLCVYMCTMCVPGMCRGKILVSNPLELQLGKVVTFHVGAGNRHGSARAASALTL